jgi:DtxR family Mn-dependent transcriptional regulator
MSVSQLSVSTQNYLKVIWSLQEWSDAPASPGRIAERTGLHLSTVSGAMPKLAEQGLVEHAPYSGVTLTEAGREAAVAMVRRHRLIETFLVRTLGYGWEQVHDEAEHLEHAVSDFMIERIDAVLEFPQRDPHGDPIPRADGTVDRPAALPLPEAVAEAVAGAESDGPGLSGAGTAPGSGTAVRVRVERISDADPGLLRHFASRGITVGARLDVTGGGPYSGGLSIMVVDGVDSVDGAAVSLALDAAGHLFVSRA